MSAAMRRATALRDVKHIGGTLVLLTTMAVSHATAQERATAVVPERPARVQVIAGFDDKCQSLAQPVIAVIRPPEKGTVSLREGQETRVAASQSGNCIGARVKGTGVYYTARPGATGSDSFTVSAKLATGEETTRTFTVTIDGD